ncbi:MAG: DUF5979 domain-containing protein, partial [Oscillospiraceae bacterium]|nr:DUF5979 domain-containing protein [Oscillospiraceae bacterium]
EKPIPGAQFELFRVEEEGGDTFLGLFTTGANGRITLDFLHPGAYYFLEANPSYGFTFDTDAQGRPIRRYDFVITGTEGGTLEAVRVTAYNKRLYADLDITKTIENNDGSPPTPEQLKMTFEFTVTFSDNGTYRYVISGVQGEFEITSGGKITLKHGQKATIKDIPVGVQYTVVETQPIGYYEPYGNNNHGNLPPGGATAAFINRAYAQLIVIKEEVGLEEEDIDPDRTYAFELWIDGELYATFTLKAGQRRLFYGLPIGAEFKVVEIVPEGADYVPVPAEYVGEIPHNSIHIPVECPFVNVYHPDEEGDLIVEKEIKDQAPLTDADLEAEFHFVAVIGEETFTFTLKHGERKVFEGLPLGTPYTITELPREGYLPAIREVSGTVAGREGVEIVIPFDNRKNGQLIVEKTVIGEDFDPEAEYDFELWIDDELYESFTLQDGERKIFANLPIGAAYTVREILPEDAPYVARRLSWSGIITGDSISYPIFCPFINVYTPDDEGDLIVKKELTGAHITDEDKQVIFDFIAVIGDETYEFSLKHGETKVFLDLPLGTEYTVTELPREGYTAAKGEVSGVIAGYGETAIIEVFDNRKNPRLIVSKTVTGEGADLEREFAFTVVVRDRAGAILETYNFVLKHGEQKEIALPTGAFTYEVTEDNYLHDFYVLKPINGQGTVDYAVARVVAAENQYVKPPTIDISGRKIWRTPTGHPLPEKIVVVLYRDGVKFAQQEVTPGANGTWSYVFGPLVKINPDTQEPYVYTVREEPIAGYDTRVDGYNIINTYMPTAQPRVKKALAGDAAPNVEFTFVMTPAPGSPAGTPMPAGTLDGRKTVKLTGAGEVSFGEIRFSQAGRYIYRITETQGSAPGWTYDGATYLLTIVVEDTNGWLVIASQTLTKDGAPVAGSVPLFTNRYETLPGYTSVKVTKVWSGEGPHPAYVQVQLYQDGKSFGSPVLLSQQNNWTYTWAQLPEGHVYTVDEIMPPEGYTRTITGNAADGFVITNRKDDFVTITPTIPPLVSPPLESTPPSAPPPSAPPSAPPPSAPPSARPSTPPTPAPPVKTGDESDIWIWTVLMIACAVALRILVLSTSRNTIDKRRKS